MGTTPDPNLGTESGPSAVVEGGDPGGHVGVEVLTDAGPSDAGVALPGCANGESLGPNGNCYAVVETLLPWILARAICRSRGTGWDLVAIEDAPTNDLVGALIADDAWVGGSDADAEGTWRWVRDESLFWLGNETGGPVDGAFNNWAAVEPNDRGDSDCVRVVAATARWADLSCGELRRAVCEGPPALE